MGHVLVNYILIIMFVLTRDFYITEILIINILKL